jgi:DNA-binding response OmpR family regulator
MPHILVIEDDQDLLYIYRTVLAQAGYQVSVASRLSEAYDILQDTPPDLVFLDMNMPDEHGISFIACVRGDTRFDDTQIVVVTADHLTQREISREDIARFLVKPVDIALIVEIARKLLPTA